MLFSPVYVKPHPRRTLASSSRLTFVSTPTISGSLSMGSSDSFTAHAPEISPRSDAHFASRIGLRDISSLERAITDKHRVLPVFSRNSQSSSPLEATLTSIPVCVDSKWFTGRLSLLESAFTRNTGERPFCLRSVSPCLCGKRGLSVGLQSGLCVGASVATPLVPLQRKAFGATIRKGTGFLHDPRKQLRSPRCLRLVSGHRGQFDLGPLCKSCLGPVPGFRVVLTNPEQAGFRVCTYKP